MIRRADPDDAPRLLPLIRAYREFEAIDGFDSNVVASALRQLLSDPRLGAGWIAVDGERSIGYLLGVYLFSLEHAGLTAEIDELFVVQDARGRGLGAKLIATAEDEFHRVGCTNVSLQVGRRNESARAFYAKSGYAQRDGYDLMEKSLEKPGRDPRES